MSMTYSRSFAPGLTRRAALGAAFAVPAAFYGLSKYGPGLIGQAAAQAPQPAPLPRSRAHTVRIGAAEVTALLTGRVFGQDPASIFAMGVPAEEFAAVAASHGLPTDRMVNNFVPTLIRIGEQRILIDAGLTPDGIRAALLDAEQKPEDITHVVMTHLHGDHIGGLHDGAAVFANARLLIPKTEYDYWAGADNAGFKGKVLPLSDRITTFDDSTGLPGGLTAVPTYGHTPGHTAYLLESQGKRLMLTGDCFNHYVFSVERPDWEVRYDMDKAAAKATRRAVLERLANERIPFIGYHMPFPAIGLIGKTTDGNYRYIPATYHLDNP